MTVHITECLVCMRHRGSLRAQLYRPIGHTLEMNELTYLLSLAPLQVNKIKAVLLVGMAV